MIGIARTPSSHRRQAIARQQSSISYTPDSSDTIHKVLDILEEEECEGLEALELGVDENGLRGVFAKLSFQPGEYICALPFPSSLLMEDNLHSDMNGIYETIQDNTIRQGLRLLQDFIHNNDNDTRLKWKPYVDTLPTTTNAHFDATPDFWEDDIIHQLQIPRMIEETLARKREMCRVAKQAEISPTDLQWASWVARTRGFSTFKVLRNDEGDEATLQQRAVLLPYLDMVNHNGVEPNASIEVVESPGSYEDSFYALQALTPISVGDEVTISYGTGRETCLDLLSTYGFWLPNDPADEFMLDWSAVNPQWTTTLEEDEIALQEATDTSLQKVLSLRIHLKQLQLLRER
jgi:hypothetical protein